MFTINQGFDLNSPQFNFKRDYFASVADLKAAAESGFPNYFITNVAGTLYQFNSANSVDANTGKWRKLNVSGYVNDGNYAKLNQSNTFTDNQILKQGDNTLTISPENISIERLNGYIYIGVDGISIQNGDSKHLYSTDGDIYNISDLESKASTNASNISSVTTKVNLLETNFDSKAQAAANTVITNKAGKANGLAQLDSTGKVPSSQLPSYVDDVLEYNNLASFPSTGETGKIYTAKDTNKIYRWSGSNYVVISETLAIGETASTAFAGNRGKNLEDQMKTKADSENLKNYLPLTGGIISGNLQVIGQGNFDVKVNKDGLSVTDKDNISTYYNVGEIVNNGKTINLPSNRGTLALTSDITAITNNKSDSSHTHSVRINGVTKTIAATSGVAVDLGTYLVSNDVVGKYLPLTGGIINGGNIDYDSGILSIKTSISGYEKFFTNIGAGFINLNDIILIDSDFHSITLKNDSSVDSDFTSLFINGLQISNSESNSYTQYLYEEIYYNDNSLSFPSKSGTIALTSDIEGYVNYNVQALTNDDIDKATT